MGIQHKLLLDLAYRTGLVVTGLVDRREDRAAVSKAVLAYLLYTSVWTGSLCCWVCLMQHLALATLGVGDWRWRFVSPIDVMLLDFFLQIATGGAMLIRL